MPTKPFFTAKTRRLDRPDDEVPDRFETPVANISYNHLGEPVYGFTPRPGLRVLRHQFDRQKVAENEAVDTRMGTRPAGFRHGTHISYEDHVKAEEEKYGYEAQLARGVARVRRTPCLKTSDQNPLRHPYDERPNADRPATAEPLPVQSLSTLGSFRSRHHDTATSPELHGAIHHSLYGQRFQAHTDFDACHARMESMQDERLQQKTKNKAHYSQYAHANDSIEEELVKQYPHGLPASKLRIARERGLKVGGLGQGHCTSMHSGQKGMMRNGGAPITRVFSFGID
ncbi:hypothetical protein WJX84_003201 [Apatococcus fuscideae]|uniref:Uncharacterized protein n=1 Tax=Apatococcus fuscideae TaxID=2026836 RepID=A0AAW1T8G1_9CHLO